MKKLKYDVSDEAFPGLEPIRKVIPQWYKDSPQFLNNDKKPRFSSKKNLVVKSCIPFLESFTTGYSLPLHVDVTVERNPETGMRDFGWGADEPVGQRDSSAAPTLPTPEGYVPTHLFWQTVISFQLPKGYSILVTHPLNRFDLPFLTLSGIIDGDEPVYSGKMPFFLKEDFTGLIPRGTPIAQLIPFKREDWELVHQEGLTKKAEVARRQSQTFLSGWYKKNRWVKKTYN
jgi:hypothetical protein